MNDWSTRAIMGVFKDRDDADKAIDDLQRLGYGINDISVIMNEGTRLRAFGTEKGTRGGEGVAVGAAAGGALGAIVAIIGGPTIKVGPTLSKQIADRKGRHYRE